VARDPGNPISYRDLASSEYNIGEIMMQLRKAKESLDSHGAALDHTKQALSLDPGNHALELKLSLIEVSLGVAYDALSRPAEHRQANRDALAIRTHLHEIEPDNAEWTRLLTWSYFWVGNDYLDNDAAEALKNYQQCLSLRQALANSDKGNLVAKYDLAWANDAVGRAYKAQGKFKDAGESFAEAFNLRKTLVAADPSNAKWRKDLALSFETIGDIADAQKHAAAALDNFKNAIAIFDDLIREAPTNGSWRDSLSNIYNKMAKIQKCSGDLDGALAGYGQALGIRAGLLAENPDNIRTLMRVATSEGLVGEVLQMRGENDKALDHYRNGADLRRKILVRMPQDEKAQKELASIEAKVDRLATEPNSSEGLRCTSS
jgi:tetratricopeptide (TPR) repeat protein